MMRDVVNVRGNVKPFLQIFFGRRVQVPKKPLIGSWKLLTHGVCPGRLSPIMPAVMFYRIP